jgi:hypothetical protein
MSSPSSQSIIQRMDDRLAAVLAEMLVMPWWRGGIEDDGGVKGLPPQLVRRAELALCCEAEGNLLLLGHLERLPASMPTLMLKSLFESCLRRAQAALSGGVEEGVVLEVLAQWREILKLGDPFAVLGACYLWKSAWPRWVKVVSGDLEALNLPSGVRSKLAEKERLKRQDAALLRVLIEDIADQYPQTESSILAGFERLLEVFPRCFGDDVALGEGQFAEWRGAGADRALVG